MSSNKKKKSFLLHKDSLDILNDLTDEEAGQLFKAIKANQMNEEMELNAVVRIAFSPFKNQFSRDNEKYDAICKGRAVEGSKGGKAKASKSKQMVANGSKCKQEVANLADSDSETKNDSDSDKTNYPSLILKIRFEEFWNAFGDKRSRKPAETAFLKIKHLNQQLFESILVGAKNYASLRPAMVARGSTSKMAQGWLTDERWKDIINQGNTYENSGSNNSERAEISRRLNDLNDDF